MKYRHFGKDNQKKAVLRSLVLNVVKNGGIETSRAKAKDAQKFIDNLITIAKDDSLASRRRIRALLAIDREMVSKFFSLMPNFNDRISGFTRIVKLGQRRGDASDRVRLEWVVSIKGEEAKVAKVSRVSKATKIKGKENAEGQDQLVVASSQ